MIEIWILLGIMATVLLVFVIIYNSLISIRNTVDESWSNIDTELKRRYNLIPNLVATVKGYAAHEQATLQAVVEARNKAMADHQSLKGLAQDENQLTKSLKQLMALSEGYPNLKASRHFLELQKELANTEDRIQAARRFYNANVRDFKNKIESVPSNWVAQLCSFEARDFFEIEDPSTVRAVPSAQFDEKDYFSLNGFKAGKEDSRLDWL